MSESFTPLQCRSNLSRGDGSPWRSLARRGEKVSASMLSLLKLGNMVMFFRWLAALSEIMKDKLSKHGMLSTWLSRSGVMNARPRTMKRRVVLTAGKSNK